MTTITSRVFKVQTKEFDSSTVYNFTLDSSKNKDGVNFYPTVSVFAKTDPQKELFNKLGQGSVLAFPSVTLNKVTVSDDGKNVNLYYTAALLEIISSANTSTPKKVDQDLSDPFVD